MDMTVRGRITRGAVALSVAVLAATIGAASCGAEKLKSQWRDMDVAIDGQSTEWDGAIHDFSDEQIGVGVRNDLEHLYVALIIGNARTQSEALSRGFTVWFDPTDKQVRTFGIRYPLGVADKDRPAFIRALMDGEDFDSLMTTYKALPARMELLASAEGPAVSAPTNDHGIEVAARIDHGLLIYELKVPLTASAQAPRAIGAQAGKAFAVGIETPEMIAPPSGRPGGERGPGGGGPGGGGGMGRGGPPPGGGGPGGGMPPGGPGGGPAAPERLSLWTTVKLSASPETK